MTTATGKLEYEDLIFIPPNEFTDSLWVTDKDLNGISVNFNGANINLADFLKIVLKFNPLL